MRSSESKEEKSRETTLAGQHNTANGSEHPAPSSQFLAPLDSALRTAHSELPICAVVVASFRPGSLIDQCLHSLLAQEGVGDVQIVVVDSSTDGTTERLRRDFPTITVIGLKQQTHQSIARNIGIAHTQAPFIAITDQDCLVPPDWLARLLARHQEDDYAVVGGGIGNGTPSSIVGTASYLIEFNEFLPTGPPRLVPMVPHCNVCFRRKVFHTVGPFANVPPGAEDQVYNFLLQQKGQRIFYDPTIAIRHQNRTGFSAFFRHQRLLGFGSAVARRTVATSGQLLIRAPVLAYLLPFVRFFLTLGRLLATNQPALLRYLLLLPLIFPGYVAWTQGFRAGLRHLLTDSKLPPHVLDSREDCQSS